MKKLIICLFLFLIIIAVCIILSKRNVSKEYITEGFINNASGFSWKNISEISFESFSIEIYYCDKGYVISSNYEEYGRRKYHCSNKGISKAEWDRFVYLLLNSTVEKEELSGDIAASDGTQTLLTLHYDDKDIGLSFLDDTKKETVLSYIKSLIK